MALVFELCLGWCEGMAANFKADSASASGALQASQVRSISLPHFEPDLPIAAGRDDFLVVCVSCHSARYVTMQPPFAERKWEEIVDKMTKIYGAQMHQEQRTSIIGYLVATHGPNAQGLPPDEDEAYLNASSKSLPHPETVPSLVFATNAVTQMAEINRGSDLFKENCAACHGPTGRGDGEVGNVLWPKPENLAATRFAWRFLGQVLWNGKRGTAMPSWRNLPLRDLSALAAYVATLHPPDETPTSPESPAVLEHGTNLFRQNCAPCHGTSADGTGPVAATLIPQPANLQLKQPDSDYILRVLRDGIAGTAMPSWANQLSETDRRALAVFVRSRFEAADRSRH